MASYIKVTHSTKDRKDGRGVSRGTRNANKRRAAARHRRGSR